MIYSATPLFTVKPYLCIAFVVYQMSLSSLAYLGVLKKQLYVLGTLTRLLLQTAVIEMENYATDQVG